MLETAESLNGQVSGFEAAASQALTASSRPDAARGIIRSQAGRDRERSNYKTRDTLVVQLHSFLGQRQHCPGTDVYRRHRFAESGTALALRQKA